MAGVSAFLVQIMVFLWFVSHAHTLEMGALRRKTNYKEGNTVIGIDLGTTYSCVGYMKNGKVEIIHNDQGNRITPSMVAFNEDGEVLIGDAAKNQLARNPHNTVFAIKRIIGRKWNNPSVQKDISLYPFKVVESDGYPKIEVSIDGKKSKLAPEEISAMVLIKMKDIAEAYLSEKVTKAVVTVPAYFNNAQRKATKEAGKLAGLDVLKILNEPTAAGIAYGFHRVEGKKNILVFDFGGGTFDVSVLTVNEKKFKVLATSGDTHLGGEDLDNRIIKFFIRHLQKNKQVDISQNQKAIQRLRRAVEEAKRALSFQTRVKVEVDVLDEGFDFSESLTRAKFQELNMDLLQATVNPLDQVLKDAKLSKENIDEVLLVGGSTRIPKIQQLVTDFFKGKSPCQGINPDEAVAYGAAVQAGILSGQDEVDDLLIIDINPLSLGTGVVGGVMNIVVPRNSELPIKISESFVTVFHDQTSVNFKVYEGERPLVKHNHLLGEFTLSGIPAAPRGEGKTDVNFEINNDGLLTVTATEVKTKKAQQLEIDTDLQRTSSGEIEEALTDMKEHEEEDKIIRHNIMIIKKLLAICQYTEQLLVKTATEAEKDVIEKVVDTAYNIGEPDLRHVMNQVVKGLDLKEAFDQGTNILSFSGNGKSRKTSHDYGSSNRYRGLQKECYSSTFEGYIYVFCPFHSVVQMKDLTAEVCGKYDNWSGHTGTIYSQQLYTKGTSCGSGQRETMVKFHCGKSERITKVTEVSKCKHEMNFETAAACLHDEL